MVLYFLGTQDPDMIGGSPFLWWFFIFTNLVVQDLLLGASSLSETAIHPEEISQICRCGGWRFGRAYVGCLELAVTSDSNATRAQQSQTLSSN